MDTDKRINISADTSNLRSEVQNSRASLKEMADEALSQIQQRTKSQEEFNAALEREIQLMQRRKQETRAMADLEYKQGMYEATSEKEREAVRAQADDFVTQDKQATEQIIYLKEILEELIRSRKEGTASEWNKYTPGANLIEVREEEIEKQRLNDEYERRNGLSTFAGGIRGYGSTIVSARNPVDLGAGLLSEGGSAMMSFGGGAAVAGISLILAGMIGKRLWNDTEKYFKARAQVFATTGAYPTESGFDYTEYGVTGTDYFQSLSGLARARRSSSGLKAAAEQQIYWKRGIGLEESNFQGMEQLSFLNGQTGAENLQSAIGSMYGAKILKGNDMSSVNDYLGVMIQLSKDQVAKLGRVDIGVNTKLVSALGSMNETLAKSPEYLQSVLSSLQGGLTNSSSPQVEALQLSNLSKLFPGKNLYELYEAREKGASTPGYAEAMFGSAKTMSGGNRMWEMTLNKMMNLSGASFAMGRDVTEGAAQFGAFNKGDYKGVQGIADIKRRAKEATTTQEQTEAEAANISSQIVTSIGGLTKQLEEQTKASTEISGRLLESNKLLDKVNGSLMRSAGAGGW